jgi:predicted RNase H-like HicB family nuclease
MTPAVAGRRRSIDTSQFCESDLPGVMAYGTSEGEAVRRVKAIALQVLADMIESGEEVPEPLRVLFAA